MDSELKQKPANEPAEKEAIGMQPRYYRIPTSLSIAAARLAKMMPVVLNLPAGVAGLTLDQRVGKESAELTLRPAIYFTRCGAWQVRVELERAQWTHAGAQVILTPDGVSVFAGSEARERRAHCCVMARLPDLLLPEPGFWAWRLEVRLAAIKRNQTAAKVWSLRMEDIVERIEEYVHYLW